MSWCAIGTSIYCAFPNRTHRSVKNVAVRHLALLFINSTCSCARASSLVVAPSKIFAIRASRDARESKPLRLINSTSGAAFANLASANHTGNDKEEIFVNVFVKSDDLIAIKPDRTALEC